MTLPFSTADKTQSVFIRKGEEGFAALDPLTVVDAFDQVVEKYGDAPALHQKVLTPGVPAAETEWTHWTWKEYRKIVDDFGKSLISLGFNKFDIINIIGFNAPEWLFANFGAVVAGGIAAGIYTTNESEACKYISGHSDAKVVVLEGVKQLQKYYSISKSLKHLKALVVYGPDDIPDDVKSKTNVPVYKFEEFLKLGVDVSDSELKARGDAIEPNQVAELIYTSGTTGPPKAVMITNDNITWTAKAMVHDIGVDLNNDDHFVSFLPLSHIAAQMLDMHVAMATGAQVWFAQPDALRGSLGATLKDVRPTIFFGVPRVWEKIYDKMQEVGKSTTGVKKILSTWAKGQASGHWEANQFGGSGSGPLMYPVAQILLKKVRQALGLDRCVACFVGAAPIETKVLNYFASVDIPILEVFGQSECTGPHTSNQITGWKIGSVGTNLDGTESKIDPENGELTYSGRHIFAGYMKMADKTAETIDSDGFLHSGDVVKRDDDGFISITGRIKELIITAGGENVPPVLIEEQMKIAMPALSNCMVIGDKRKFLSILLCLQVEISDDGIATNKLTGAALDTCKEIGSSATTTEEAATCEKWKAYFDAGVKTANDNATSRAQKVQKWTLLNTDFTEPGGELTPTLKLKRSVAADIHSAAIEAMY